MNARTTCNSFRAPFLNETGMTLLEVVMGILIFVVGMLALAHLQGNLTRSSADANARTVAANIAEEIIEDQRGFEVIATQVDKKAYDDIVDETRTVSRGGIDYTVDIDVQDYFFSPDRVSVQSTAPSGVTASSFKYAELTVSWNTDQQFQIDQTQTTEDMLGSGSITVSGIIPSVSPLNNARVAAEDDGVLGFPLVNYTPGAKPEIVAINLGASKFKESTTPEPVVRRENELVETWFDVITYTSNGTNATFMRREEFVSISCECTLRAAAGDDGRQPTVWTGSEYAEGLVVDKPFGEVANNQQSQYCDVCCKDHHDTASGTESYRPGASFDGDHPHYGRTHQGVLQLADVGDDYYEACRLVRKDGFFRVAQDFDLQNEIAFPENYLDQTGEVDAYSTYVTGAVEDHFSASPSADYWLPSLDFEGNADDNRTILDATDRQYRSRGIYTDVVNSALAANLAACFDLNGYPTLSDPDCTITEAASPIEVYPFFDVQVTQLARWTETQLADPVDVSNEEISNTGYSRGKAKLAGQKTGDSTEHSTIEKGNVGLISIPSIREPADTPYVEANLWVVAGDGGPVGEGGVTVSGSISNARQTGNAVPSVIGAGADCTRPTNSTFVCVLDMNPIDPTITVSNYYKLNTDLIACASDELVYLGHFNGTSLTTNWTRFELPTTEALSVVITIVQGSGPGSCP